MVTNTESPKLDTPKPYKTITYEKKPPIAYVTLNRPEKLNAISEQMRLELRDALGDAGWDDRSIRVIVIKGAGRGFSAGWDLSEAPARFERLSRKFGAAGRYWNAKHVHLLLWEVIWENPKPVIAQVHGFCVAAGMAVASQSDLCICSEDALFGYPMVRTGGPFITVLNPSIIGMKKAKELMYTGNLMDAQEAWRVGLVTKVVPRDKLDEEVNKLARTISKVAEVVVEYSKKAINNVYELQNIRKAHEWGDEYEILPDLSMAEESNLESREFRRIEEEQGLKAALDWRQSRFLEGDSWWIERQKARKL